MSLKNPFTLSAAALLLIGSMNAFAQSAGSLDASFGVAGVSTTYPATTDNNLLWSENALQGDGKFLVLYDAHLNTGNTFTNAVIRYRADGSVDTDFGSGGFLHMNWSGIGGQFGNAYALAVQHIGAEDKILVGGTATTPYSGLRVDRYNADGSVDSSFGTGGRAYVSNGGYAAGLAVQGDGKILSIGEPGQLVRLNSDGTLDTAFGSGGIRATGINGIALAIQSDGRILVFGGYSVKHIGYLGVTRYNTNGSLDDGTSSDSTPGDTFGSAGHVALSFLSDGSVNVRTDSQPMRIDSAGHIVIACEIAARKSTNSSWGVARLNENGQYDTTFDGDGRATIDPSEFRDGIAGVAVQADGRILVTGFANTSSITAQNPAVARFLANGTLDTSFGSGGKVITNFSTPRETGFAGLVQLDPACGCEKLMVGGTAEINGIDYATAARYTL